MLSAFYFLGIRLEQQQQQEERGSKREEGNRESSANYTSSVYATTRLAVKLQSNKQHY
jgi:hypothetical protein